MQDLQTIHKINAQAVKDHIPKVVAAGKHAVAKYTGLNFHSYSEHDTIEEANAAALKHNADCPGNSSRIHSPAPVAA